MPAPPPRMLESEAEYEWRCAAWYPDRYVFDPARHPAFAARMVRRFRRLQRLGALTGWWAPLLAFARRWHLLDPDDR